MRNSYGLILALLFSLSLSAQVDTSKVLQVITANGYAYRNIAVDSSFYVPADTFRLKSTYAGRAIAAKGNVIYLWGWYDGVLKWQQISGGVELGTDFYIQNGPSSVNLKTLGYEVNDSTLGIKSIGIVAGTGVTIDTLVGTDSIRWTINAGTPDLQAVTDVGNYTTQHIGSPSFKVKPLSTSTEAAWLSASTAGTENVGELMLKTWGQHDDGARFTATVHPVDLTASRLLYLPNEDDTLATRGFVRGLASGGSGSLYVGNSGNSGERLLWTSPGSPDTLYGKRLVAGSGITLTNLPDSSVSIASTGGSAWELDGNTTGVDRTIGPNDYFALGFETNGTQRGSITKDGMLDWTDSLYVRGTTGTPGALVSIKTANTASTDFALDIQSSSGTSLFKVRNDGQLSGVPFTVFTATNLRLAGAPFAFQSANTGASAQQAFTFAPLNSQTATSGLNGTVQITGSYAPTSGTGVHAGITVVGTINQTGGASGVTRGLFLNQTITAAADYRAIDVVIGKSYFRNIHLYTAGDKINIATGSNASVGTATLASGTVTVSTTAVSASSIIYVVHNTPSGTVGVLSVPTASITAATSFIINSSSASDNSTVNWWIIN